ALRKWRRPGAPGARVVAPSRAGRGGTLLAPVRQALGDPALDVSRTGPLDSGPQVDLFRRALRGVLRALDGPRGRGVSYAGAPGAPVICPACRADNEAAAETCFKCGRGLLAVIEGSLLGPRYETRKPLGRGGAGVVYQAYDRQVEAMVALKVLRSEIARSPDMARRFRAEIRLARMVRH